VCRLSDEKIELTNTLDQNEVFDDILCQAKLKHANIADNPKLYGSYRTGKADDLGGSDAGSVPEELNSNLSCTDQLQEFLTRGHNTDENCMGSNNFSSPAN
jgi:hypothetical protein